VDPVDRSTGPGQFDRRRVIQGATGWVVERVRRLILALQLWWELERSTCAGADVEEVVETVQRHRVDVLYDVRRKEIRHDEAQRHA
jgi:hypothetical protein